MECCGPGYASPAAAMKAPREKILYTIAIYTGTGIQKPDYLATIDADEDSPGPFRAEGWWHEPTVQHDAVAQGDAGDNVVKVIPNAWIEYGLTWPDDTPVPTANTVVFANFSKNED